MKVTYYDYEPGGGRSQRVRDHIASISISKTENGCGPYVFGIPEEFRDFTLPPVLICRAEHLLMVECDRRELSNIALAHGGRL